MHPKVNAIAGRLSLRPPQRHALEILDEAVSKLKPAKGSDLKSSLDSLREAYPQVKDFEREFPSLCFSLATGVGKTRLMGAFIAYLHLAHGKSNFFVLAPNPTIYNKLIADFTPNTPKYVFRGIAEFAQEPPEIITGDDYQERAGTLFDATVRCKINIFNISKINSEVRGGKSPRIKRLSEYIGESYFDYLAGLPDLVLLMDESHRYRASAGVRSINELKPILGLELTATPFVETPKGPIAFSNVIQDYPLARAMEDGFVKEPFVATRKNFNPASISADDLERMKLEDGVRLHEQTKVHLETYAREQGLHIVKPFVLVIARDTYHAAKLLEHIESNDFFSGHYRGKAIQVDSSKTGAEEDEMVKRLLRVESADEKTEIVIHVNMLKEGWDVTNLYTIVPLRAANARVLIEQSIGRGLRLPYGKRTGVIEVDRLSIVAHDKFQEIIDEANRSDSPLRVKALMLDEAELKHPSKTVVSQSTLETKLGLKPQDRHGNAELAGLESAKPAFVSPDDLRVAQAAYEVIKQASARPSLAPSSSALQSESVLDFLVNEVESRHLPKQLEMGEVTAKPDVRAIVTQTAKLFADGVIDIPRIMVTPVGEVLCGFNAFQLNLDELSLPPTEEEILLKSLESDKTASLVVEYARRAEGRTEDYIVSSLIDFDDICYDQHADLLYDLAGQYVTHLKKTLTDDEADLKVRQEHRFIARRIHGQMQAHYWEKATAYETKVNAGFTPLKPSAYTASATDKVQDYRQAPEDKNNYPKYLFGGFTKCLYPVTKFDSNPERLLAVILEREASKWFRPAKGQFQIHYRDAGIYREYQPDFVAEVGGSIHMMEPKARNRMDDAEVQSKRDAAIKWCERATEYAKEHGGKPWKYSLIPHDIIAENMTVEGLAKRAAESKC